MCCGVTMSLAALVLAMQLLGADNKPVAPPPPPKQEYPSCGKRFVQKYSTDLDQKQRTYRDQRTIASYDKADLDNEGTLDSVIVQSVSAVEPCNMMPEWYQKRTSIQIRYDADHYFNWEGITPGLITEFDLLPSKQQITLKGKTYNGESWQQTVPYTTPEGR